MDAVTRRREQRKATAPGIAVIDTGPFRLLPTREHPLLVHTEAPPPGCELLRQGSETSYQGPVCPKLCLLFEVASATTFAGEATPRPPPVQREAQGVSFPLAHPALLSGSRCSQPAPRTGTKRA